MPALSPAQLHARLFKPVAFVLCSLPLLWLALQTFELAGLGLGANPVERLLHECGKWGLNLLLITLCVTPLARIAGWRWAYRYRRMLGLFAFFYLVLHLSVYLLLDQSLLWSAIVEDVLERPYITLGMTGLLLLVPLAATSTDGMMRRLGRNWQRLHRLVYPAAILGTCHYYWQVKQDILEPLLYAAALALLLGWRVARAGRSRRPAARQRFMRSVSPRTR